MRRTLLLVCVACGNDDVHHLADSGIDSPPPQFDAPPANVTVTVTQNGAPVAGLSTYFQNADSSVVASPVTDASGKASVEMAAGGFVTVLEPLPAGIVNNQKLDTFTAVKPGDDLHVDIGSAAAGVTVTFNLTVPTDPDLGATIYTLFTTCGSADITPPLPALRRSFAATDNPPVQVSLTDCNGVADMLVVTSDGNGISHDALFYLGQPVADAQDVTLPGSYAPFIAQQFDYTNLPASVTDVDVVENLITSRGFVFDQNVAESVPSGGSASIPDTLPPATGATAVANHTFAPDATIVSEQFITDWGAPNAGGSIDYGAVKLGDYTTAPSYDVAGHKATWTVGAGVAPDLAVAVVLAQRTDGSTWAWEVVAPGTSDGAVAYPTLPTDVFDFNFQATDTLTLFAGSSTFPGGYDAVRPHAFAFDPSTAAIGGTTGRIVAEQFHPPPVAELKHTIWRPARDRRVIMGR